MSRIHRNESCEVYQHGTFEGTPVETQCHCRHAKSSWFAEDLTADPQHAHVEDLFRYPLGGKIVPEKRLVAGRYQAAERTIAELNLNAPSLVERRRSILTRASEDILVMTHDAWRARYIEPNATGQLQEFWPALSDNYRRHWVARLD